MKKIALLASALIVMCSAVSAQDFGWGVKVGLNISGASNLDEADSQSKTGLVVGAFADYFFTDRMGLSAEVLYSRQGVSFDTDLDESKIRMNYLNVPILFNYRVLGGLAVKAGIQPGFLLNSKAIVKEDGNTAKSDIEGTNSVDFAIPIGLSYELPFGIFVDARYNIGVSKIIEHSSVRNSVFQLTAGMRF